LLVFSLFLWSDRLRVELTKIFSEVDEYNYIGKTYKHANERFIEGHLNKAFSKEGTPDFHRFIKKYCSNKDVAKDLFRVEILQVLDYDVYLDRIGEVTDLAEQYWIGYYRSQFRKYGLNTAMGGDAFGRGDTSLAEIDFETFDGLLRDSIHISLADNPLNWIAERLPNDGSRRWFQEECYSIYGKSYSKVRKEYIQEELLPLIKEGWRGHEIAEKFGLSTRRDEAIMVNGYERTINPSGTYRVSLWCKELFNDDTMDISRVRKIFLPAIIKGLVRNGFFTYEEIADQLPGASARTIEKYCFDELGAGWKELRIKIYQRYKAIDLLLSRWESSDPTISKLPLRTQILIEVGVTQSTARRSPTREWARLFEGIEFREVATQIHTGFIGGKSVADWINPIKSRAERNIF